MQLNNTENTVLNLLAHSLFNVNRKLSDRIVWEDVFEECVRQTVTILGLSGAKDAGAPKEVLQNWEKATATAAYNNLRVSWEHNELGALMKNAGIPYVILKGCASALYYPAPINRIMGDVDFLVPKEYVDKAGQILEENGFIPWDIQHICHIVYSKPPTHLEMHFEPAGVPNGEMGKRVRDYLSNIMDQAVELPYENGNISCPSPFHHGLILLLHTSHHLTGEGIGLRHLCDWAVFAASFSDDEFRNLFEEKLKAIGLWKFAKILTRTAEIYLGCPHRAWAGDIENGLAYDIIREIFEGGNFGIKKEERIYESYLISNRGKDGVRNESMVKQFFQSMNHIVCSHWPIAERIWIIQLIGWGYFGGRYLVRMIMGRRKKVHIKNMVERARERRTVYQEFQLFEKE